MDKEVRDGLTSKWADLCFMSKAASVETLPCANLSLMLPFNWCLYHCSLQQGAVKFQTIDTSSRASTISILSLIIQHYDCKLFLCLCALSWMYDFLSASTYEAHSHLCMT